MNHSIKILSHNVYWFQGHPFRSDQPKNVHTEIFPRLIDFYLKESPDFICLQEIQNSDVAEMAQNALKMNGAYSKGMKFSQYGGATFGKKDWQLDIIPADYQRERSLVVTRFSDPKHSLTIANIHLPSGRQATSQTPAEMREQEIREFLSRLGETIDILVGDFNEDYGLGVSNRLLEAGFVDCSVVKGQDHIPASINGKNRRDMIWVKSALKNHLIDYRVLSDNFRIDDIPEKISLSDHLPVMVTLEY